MRIGFVDAAGARPVRLTRRLNAAWRLRAAPSRPCLPPPKRVDGGLVFGLDAAVPGAALAQDAPAVGAGCHGVEQVLDQRWVGEDLLLTRVAMLDLCSGEGFERWFVADTSARCVAVVCHDLVPSAGGVFRSIRANDPDHAWLQYVHVVREGERVGQTEMADGGVLELHRVPVSWLLTKPGERERLVGRSTRVCAPTLGMLTGGAQTELALGEAVLVDDVEVRPEGGLSLVVVHGAFDLGTRTSAVRDLYELTLSRDGRWRSSGLFDSVEDAQLMLL